MSEQRPTYQDWATHVPPSMTGDVLWKMQAYRFGLYAADLAWHDATRLAQDRRTRSLADQLYRAVGSISANVAEGYSRGSGRDRARFYEYALGSAREARDWYYKSRHVLGDEAARHRMDLLTRLIRLLLTMVPNERSSHLREPEIGYASAAGPDVGPASTPFVFGA